MRWLLAILMLLSGSAHAQQVATSGESIDTSVTIYRDPYRGEGPINRQWPGGYALISERRTVTIPAGEAVIRFEGVAEGILPESAIVTGLPTGVREKNQDARLISPAGLVDANLKRRVSLVRTNEKTGKVTRQDAVVQSGPSGGVILTTPDGVEALGCAGLPERMAYSGVPQGLSAKPTLSVLTTAKKSARATVTLTYLAQGFDWSAHYVAEAEAKDQQLRLLAWATLVNGGSQSFANARVQLIAGRANYTPVAPAPRGEQRLILQCWPADVTSTHPRWFVEQLELITWRNDPMLVRGMDKQRRMKGGIMMMPPPPPVARYSPAPATVEAAMMATQENLGDLKLYRIPERVTVAAQATKQVAMIFQDRVSFSKVYVAPWHWQNQPVAATIAVDSVNEKSKGLGLPLPGGAISFYEAVNGESFFVGEDRVPDYASGEDVRFRLGASSSVKSKIESLPGGQYRVTLSNANDWPVPVEVQLYAKPFAPNDAVTFKRGVWVWRVDVPANDEISYSYTPRFN